MACCGASTNLKPPKLTEQVKNLTLTMANVIAHATQTGQVMAKEDLIKKRLDICNSCQYRQNNRCNICGCVISIKTGLQAADCPLKKW